MTPTQRSLAKLRADGYFVAVVEKWNPHVRIRQDLFGFADLLGFKGDEVLLVQTTSGSNVASRVAKIAGLPVATAWLNGRNHRVIVHGWRKAGPRGGRKTWQCREVECQPAPSSPHHEPDGLGYPTPVMKATVGLPPQEPTSTPLNHP